MHFTTEPIYEIWHWLIDKVAALDAGDSVAFEVLNPDLFANHYAGNEVTVGGKSYLYRSYKAWSDLAEALMCRMLTPVIQSETTVVLRFQKLDIEASFHTESPSGRSEKYGVGSSFFAIHKNEEPAFMIPFAEALQRTDVAGRKRVLNLGINRGDEFDLIRQIVGSDYQQIELVGIDFSQSAIDFATDRFDAVNTRFYCHDINELDALDLGRFDLIVSIGTLQSPGIEFKPLLANLVQNYLEPKGALILGFPNCRWMGGEMIYGAKAPNYPFSEQSLLYKDVHYSKKYLQQKKFRVTLTGKPYLFLTATPIRSRYEKA